MKRSILFLAGIISILKINAQSLPPVAQTLYNECYNADVMQGQYAITNGVQVLATADGNSFYLKWLPVGATPSLTPMLVTLHGSNGRAFVEFFNWHQKAMAKGVGIIALQWYRGAASVSPNDYFDDNTLYTYIDTALKRIKYPSNKAMYHGFSRGSARSYAVAFKDVQPGGKNYFCTVLSNAGKPDSAYPLYSSINTGSYGHSFYSGKQWAMYCGADDPDKGQSGCQGMNMAKNWVIANGGSVGLYIQGPSPQGHDGFHTVPAYIDSVLNYYLTCFNGNVGLKQNSKKYELDVFPNPCKGSFEIRCDAEIADVEIFNTIGQIVYREKINASHKQITPGLKSGIYFLKIDFGIANEMKKIIIEE